MLEPPVSTPISRMTANAASRIIWYSLSVSVCAGATVIESPVCTPIGSKFSMEQTTTQLSIRSRITSISNSFQPTSDSSINTSRTGETSSPRARAVAVQFHRRIERCLPAESRQNRVRFLTFHDCLDHFRSDRLDVSAIGELRIGHDRCGVGVHEHNFVSFLAKRFACLHAGIIKLAALPDHDWTRADKQNLFELVISRHLRQGGQ